MPPARGRPTNLGRGSHRAQVESVAERGEWVGHGTSNAGWDFRLPYHTYTPFISGHTLPIGSLEGHFIHFDRPGNIDRRHHDFHDHDPQSKGRHYDLSTIPVRFLSAKVWSLASESSCYSKGTHRHTQIPCFISFLTCLVRVSQRRCQSSRGRLVPIAGTLMRCCDAMWTPFLAALLLCVVTTVS